MCTYSNLVLLYASFLVSYVILKENKKKVGCWSKAENLNRAMASCVLCDTFAFLNKKTIGKTQM